MNGEITDEMLMLRYREGDALAFDTLYSRHERPLYRYFALRRHCTEKLAEDLAQDVWMSVIRGAAGYEVTARFTTWLYRIARNRFLDHLRAQGVRPEESHGDLPEEVENLAAPDHHRPDRQLERQQLAHSIGDALKSLPTEQSEVFLLQQETDLTLEEMASLLGVGRETVKSRLRYATQKLRGMLAGIKS